MMHLAGAIPPNLVADQSTRLWSLDPIYETSILNSRNDHHRMQPCSLWDGELKDLGNEVGLTERD